MPLSVGHQPVDYHHGLPLSFLNPLDDDGGAKISHFLVQRLLRY